MTELIVALAFFGLVTFLLGLYSGLVFAGKETGRAVARLPREQADAFLAALGNRQERAWDDPRVKST